MRSLDPGFAAHIRSGATTLAHCWRLTRTDGLVLGFTDHDLALCFEDTQFSPSFGLEGGEITAKLGPQTDTSEVLGILASEAINEDDIVLGRFDGAMVEMWRVNWRDTAQRHLLRRDSIGEIVREDGMFRAELRSAQHALNRVVGHFYQANCDAELGDGRCGIDLESAQFRVDVAVVDVRDRYRLELTGQETFASTWFTNGRALWISGKLQGLTDRIGRPNNDGSDDVFGFDAPVGDWVEAGDTLTLFAGCDHSIATCAQKFGNAINFRGCPHIPGNDFLMRYPKAGSDLSGGPLLR